MDLRLYNTLSRAKQTFQPLDKSRIGLYVCGPTVYDYAHIGNARPVIVFDLLFRLLRTLYGQSHVIYVRNITDVDDKINARAVSEGVSIGELTKRTTAAFHKDIAALGCLPPTIEPRATEHIGEMQDIIQRLITNGHAYIDDGHVLFSVPSMPDYGQLSRRSLEDMMAGARVEVAPYKRNEMDFVLWKPSNPEDPGWDSPWGRGRPGWHIECSAMSFKHLGEVFDIHGGGIDLIFPHHENEIAQNCCAFHTERMAQIWMHNGFLQVEGQKMSKSLGNFYTIFELLNSESLGGRSWTGAALRLTMLKTNYRQPIDFAKNELEASNATINQWTRILTRQPIVFDRHHPVPPSLLQVLCDDLNTPKALAALHGLAREAESGEAKKVQDFFAALTQLGFADILDLKKAADAGDKTLHSRVEAAIAERLAARLRKDFAASDRIRDELKAQGIVLQDNKDGTSSWELTP